MKLYLIFGLLFLLPYVSAVEESFNSNVIVKIMNDNTTCNVNITMEGESRYYNCFSNLSSDFNSNIKRNVTLQCDYSPLNNFTSKVDGVMNTCNNILKQYGDVNTYFKSYVTCDGDLKVCKNDIVNKDAKITELSPFKANYEMCNVNSNNLQNNLNNLQNNVIPVMQNNMSSMQRNLDVAKKAKFTYLIIGAVAIGGIAFFRERSRSPLTQKDREIGLTGVTRR